MKVMDSLRLQLIVAANALPCAIECFLIIFILCILMDFVFNNLQNGIVLTSFSNRFKLENAT
jgi:hypothetical protein